MTKKQEGDLQEFRSKASKAASLAKKINEADKIGMTHRKKQYLSELESTMKTVNELYQSVKNV